MRRWNGWTDEGDEVALPEGAVRLLESLLGPGRRPQDATLDEVRARVRASRLPAHPLAGPARAALRPSALQIPARRALSIDPMRALRAE